AMAKDLDANVREIAITVLSKLRGKEAIPDLTNAAKYDESREVRDTAQRELIKYINNDEIEGEFQSTIPKAGEK
ncbi:MAG: HEAT repeat domain-containing protein, partial [Candidatus Dadabacteria bacterium]|nr:HEAT repeat domain-containing protein [Candidatus Dadabacteria bacterium]